MIPGMSDREVMISVAVLGLALLGSIGHYVYHKWSSCGIRKSTKKGFARAGILGIIAGFLWLSGTLVIVPFVSAFTVPHWAVVTPALFIGGNAESIVGKYLGWKSCRHPKVVKTDEEKLNETAEKTGSDIVNKKV